MQSAPLTFRQARAGDGEVVFQLHINSVHALCRRHYSEEQLQAWFVGRSSANYRGAIRQGALWIAERESSPLGFTEFFPGLISMLFVSGEAAGSGVGRGLLEFALAGARTAPEGAVRLESTLNAKAFYERHGFVAVGSGHLVRGGGVRLPTVKMEHRLVRPIATG